MRRSNAPLVAYQGEPGAFSDDAARRLLPEAETVGFGTFDDAAAAVQAGKTTYALLPCENSISGSVPRVYDLLWADERLGIVDEIVYRVVQNLIGLPTATPETLREVRSHPVALEQCRRFLAAHANVRSTIVADTAGAVREIARLGDPAVGAIASALAAERYGVRVLAAGIQDIDDNFTRFFLLQRDGVSKSEPTRACVALSLAHRPGALRDALAAFAGEGLNLRTLVSRPSLEEPFTYRFYCEVAPASPERLSAALARVDGATRVLGHY
ncbi:MAG: prephenate dehydratase [Candidatus Eremiobacteraeota bacterium]|nr:prephenate dehydratase [Candidatus Eremiobacteraeota bacterium]